MNIEKVLEKWLLETWAPKVREDFFPMTKPADGDDAPFVLALEIALRKVLRDETMDPADTIKAIEAGTRLLAVKHKIKDGAEKENFFGGQK